jgi:hypothetical protein
MDINQINFRKHPIISAIIVFGLIGLGGAGWDYIYNSVLRPVVAKCTEPELKAIREEIKLDSAQQALKGKGDSLLNALQHDSINRSLNSIGSETHLTRLYIERKMSNDDKIAAWNEAHQDSIYRAARR